MKSILDRKILEPELRWMSWYEWKAESLNRMFQKYGVLKQRGRITAETVRDGEEKLKGVR